MSAVHLVHFDSQVRLRLREQDVRLALIYSVYTKRFEGQISMLNLQRYLLAKHPNANIPKSYKWFCKRFWPKVCDAINCT